MTSHADHKNNVLEVKGLTKEFGDFKAVDNISFSIPKGKIIGFLGPNGAGKTTTIAMLLGLTRKDSGSISYFGKDFTKNKSYCLNRINYTSAFSKLLGRITIYENLYIFSQLYGIKNPKKKIYDLMEYLDAMDLLKKDYWDLSAGQKTRVNIVKSLLNDPDVLLMDEPTASLDPDISDKVLTLIEELRRDRNMSILFTSHKMDEVTRICDDVIFLQHGKIIAQDTPKNLVKQITDAVLSVSFSSDKKQVVQYLSTNNYKHTFSGKKSVSIELKETEIPKALFGFTKEEVWITDIDIKKPDLEDLFLHIARDKK